MSNRMFSLPPIENNVGEGIVIKPVKSLYLPTGRPIFKKKTEKFTEHMTIEKVPKKIPLLLQNIYRELLSTATESRVAGVISKHGNVPDPKLISLVIADAMEDFLKDHGEEFGKLSERDQVKLKVELAKSIKNVIVAFN